MFESKEAKETKKIQKQEETLRKYGLDIENYSVDELIEKNAIDIKGINSEMAGSSLFSFGNILSGNAADSFLINLLRAQIKQNWILIRQNEIMIRELKK